MIISLEAVIFLFRKNLFATLSLAGNWCNIAAIQYNLFTGLSNIGWFWSFSL